MNIEQLEQAKKKTEELLKYTRQTESIKQYIEKVIGYRRISLSTSHNTEMWTDWESTYDMIGEELIELLKKKLWEREDYLDKLNSDDLITLTNPMPEEKAETLKEVIADIKHEFKLGGEGK